MAHSIVEPFRSRPTGYRTGVSLHAHTNRSRESLDFLPSWVRDVPVLGRLWERERARQRSSNGGDLDLSRGFWCPPASPLEVLDSEVAEVRRRLGLDALVSLTDHDSFDAPLALNALDSAAAVPLSIEWTVHSRSGRFHLGVHNVPLELAWNHAATLAPLTVTPDDDGLADMLRLLSAAPATLIVLNHPLWDGDVNHRRGADAASAFLERHRPWIHAVELNGYRRWSENQAAMALAERWRLPVVAGGDRHGRAPNALLNLSQAGTFDEFVGEIRDDRRSHVLVMPEYFEQPAAREFAALADILGTRPRPAEEQRHWTERVFLTDEAGRACPLAEAWDGRIPWWISSFIGVLRLAGSAPARPLLRLALAGGQINLF